MVGKNHINLAVMRYCREIERSKAEEIDIVCTVTNTQWGRDRSWPIEVPKPMHIAAADPCISNATKKDRISLRHMVVRAYMSAVY